MRRIGLTGPIGCGKSTIARLLAERPRVVVIDADDAARDALEPGTAEEQAVFARFGPSVQGTDGSLDRAALARIVFADPVALRDLEAIVHPAVRPRIIAALGDAERSGADLAVIEAIKLVEGGLAELCDEVWLVTCDPAVQLERVVGRNRDQSDATARIHAQGDIADRLRPHATRVVDTSGSMADVRAAVDGYLAPDDRGG